MSAKLEKDESNEKKVGVYICHCGGNISDHVDVQQLKENVKKIPGVSTAHTNMFMCSDPGQEVIQQDIKAGKINRVVVASCAPSLHELTFRGAIKRADMNPYLYEHANIREQVSWVHDGQQATAKATRLVAAAIAKTKKQEALEPIRVDAKRHALVLGGGIAGIRAASDLSRRGIQVVLIEKSPFLGGRTANLDKLVPSGEKAADLIRQLSKVVLADPNITVMTCAEVVRSEGYVGNFSITVKRRPPRDKQELEKLELVASRQAGVGDFIQFAGIFAGPVPTTTEEVVLETGALVFATGFAPYVPLKGEYGFGENPEVITLPDLIRYMAESPASGSHLQIGGRKIERVALIHCVGSRQIPGLHEADAEGHLNEYCSRTCCSATLQAASEIRERFPATRVFEYYRDIRTYGRGQEEYYERASKNQVIFLRFEPEEPPVVQRAQDSKHPLMIKAKDTLTFGEVVEAEVDLVVLAVGMQPSNISDLVDMMKLPVGADRFLLEVHPKLRPVELANTGILLAGTCQAPMDVSEACNAAQAASAKASILLTKGFVELDPFVAEVNLDRCTGRGACQEACPIEGAIQLVEVKIEGQTVKRARVSPALCTGCGTCVAACPDNAIDVKGWELEQYEAMVDAIVAD